MKILIVEDDLFFAENLRERLQEMGYTVTAVAPDAAFAMESFRASPPDLALLDIQLEGSAMDGIELAKVLQQIHQVPLIFLTGKSDEETLRRAKAARPANFLLKPCSKEQLEVALELALDNFTRDQLPETPRAQPLSAPRCPLYSSDEFFFALDKKRHYIKVEVARLVYAEGNGSITNLYILGRRHPLLPSVTLGSFERQVAHPHLLRIHKSYIVNLLLIDGFDDDGVYVNHDGRVQVLPVGPKYREELGRRLKRLKAD